MTNVESLAKLKELLDSGAISQAEFDEQKKSILSEETQKRKKNNVGLIVSVAVVVAICIGIISGNTSETPKENNVATEVQTSNVPSEFEEACPVDVTASIYDNIIGVPELKCNFKNLKEKEIAAIKLYFEPRDVYGESINSIFMTNQLQTDETIAALASASCAWQLLDDAVKSGDLYVYSVYFSDGSEWGNKDAAQSEAKKYGLKISAKY